MKLLTVIVVIGFCLFAVSPISLAEPRQEKRASCCMGDGSTTSARMGGCHMPVQPGQGHACNCSPAAPVAKSGPSAHSNCGCSSLVTNTAQPVSLFERLRRYATKGYRRITGKNLLEHETRRIVYETILASPGIDLKTLTQITGMNENTLRYHLERMQESSKIQVASIGGSAHFFENHGRYSKEEQTLIARMFTEGSGRILQTILRHPGISRGELAEMLGVAGPTVTRSMTRLIHEGLILQERDGRFVRYYPQAILMQDKGSHSIRPSTHSAHDRLSGLPIAHMNS